jgi:hypothetical protein
MFNTIVYSILQFGSGILVFIILFLLYHTLTYKFKVKVLPAILIIIIPYFFIGIFTYNKEKKRIGAVCCDDWDSNSIGSGTCSSHGGVKEWVVMYRYKQFEEPFNTFHKIFYFWYALNEDHQELEYIGCNEEDEELDDPETKYHLR